ncbi:imelysin family protein [Vibrio amylolyticus]|uniref:imelysin family protein n=1 Tax=Vibrio amylolyticus TaxID=2847292 RepID=UPI00355231A2
MKRFQLTALAALFSVSVGALVGCQSTEKEQDKQTFEMTTHASQNVYQVQFQSAAYFAQQATLLNGTFSEFCASLDSEDGSEHVLKEQSLKQQWHETMLAWMAIQGQERGPEQALEQSWNVQFWPDKKNTTGRKMSAITKQDKAWSAAEISEQSVTVQGLGAIEWLLYDPASKVREVVSVCQTGNAITENLANNAETIHRAWASNPWTDLDDKQWQSEYMSLLSNQLEYSLKKMSRPLANFGKPRPYFAESWRSETSLNNLSANIMALQTLYLANGQGLDRILREEGHAALADSILGQFESMLETWPDEQSMFELLKSKQGTKFVYAQYNKLEQLNYLIREEAAIKLGIVIGFNATDGD